MEILFDYGKFFFNIYGYCIWQNSKENPDSSIQEHWATFERCSEKYMSLIESIYSNLNEYNFYSIECQLILARLLTANLQINRLKIIELASRKSKVDTSLVKKQKKDIVRRLIESLDNLLSFFNSKSIVLKMEIQNLSITSAFDRYLFREYLFDYLRHERTIQVNVFGNESEHFKNTDYLECLETCFESSNESLLNDEYENLFFDKFYSKLMEKYQIFEAANSDANNTSIYQTQVGILTQRSTTNSTFEEKYNLSKKLYANIRKQCDETFYLKLQVLNFIKQLICYQSSVSHVTKIRKCEIKCLFALIQLHVEYKNFFDSNSVVELTTAIGELFHVENPQTFLHTYKTELLYQWLEINYDPAEDICDLFDLFPYELFGYESYFEFLRDQMAYLISFYCVKMSEEKYDEAQLISLFNLWLSSNEKCPLKSNEFSQILGSNHELGVTFYSTFIISSFINSNKTPNKLMKKLISHSLIDLNVLKKYFHFIFKKLFTCSQSRFFVTRFVLNESESKALVFSFSDILLDVFTENQEDIASRSKPFLNLIQNCLLDSMMAPKNLSETAIFKIIFDINSEIINQKTMPDFLYLLELYRTFLQTILFNSSKGQTFNILSNMCTKNFYQLAIHHFILFKLANLVEICHSKLADDSSSDTFNSTNKLFEVNVFNQKVLNTVFDILHSFLDHINLNQMEVFYFDWPLSCVIWHLLDYINFHEGLNGNSVTFKEFNRLIFSQLITLISRNSTNSERLKRFERFLRTILVNSENHLFKTNSIRSVLMFNLTNLIKLTKMPQIGETVHFVNELKSCLKSYDFERVETSRFILSYLSNLLIREFRTNFNHKSTVLQSTTLTQEALRLFVNKLLNLSNIYKDSLVLKKLSCLCLSVIGPIDFQAYHLPIDKMEKFEKCFDFTKTFANLNDYSSNIQGDRRLFILQHLTKYSGDHMIQFYYFLIEYLLQYLIGNNNRMAQQASNLLNKIFQTSNMSLFLNEYEKYSKEFDNTLEIYLQMAEGDVQAERFDGCYSVDFFLEYTRPFITKKSKTIESNELKKSIDFSDMSYWTIDGLEYSNWLTYLIKNFLTSNAFTDEISVICVPLLQDSIEICQVFLPYLMENLFTNNKDLTRIIGYNINKALKLLEEETKDESILKSIKIYLKLIEFFRKKTIKKTNSSKFWENSQFLGSFDFLIVARAALACGMHCQSLYYIEVWCSQEISKLKSFRANFNLDLLYKDPSVLKLMFDAYKSIGEKSALNSELLYLIDAKHRVEFYEEKNYAETLYAYDNYLNNEFADDSNYAQIGLLKALQNNGFDGLLKNFIQNISNTNTLASQMNESSELVDAKFYSSWKLGMWDNDKCTSLEPSNSSFNKNFHSSLNFVVNQNQNVHNKSLTVMLDKCENLLFTELQTTNIESVNLLNPIIGRFYNLDQIKNFMAFRNLTTEQSMDEIKLSETLWNDYELCYFPQSESFDLVNDLFSVKSIISKQLLKEKPEMADPVRNYLASIQDKLIDHSILHKRFQLGQSKIAEMRKFTLYPIQCALKESQLLKEKFDLQRAKFIIKKAIDNFDEELSFVSAKHASNTIYNKKDHYEYLMRSMDLYAKLLNETKSENPTVIIKDLLEKSILIAKEQRLNLNRDKMNLIANSFYSLGKFADEKYQSICEHIQSTSFEEHTELMRQFQLEKTRVSIVEPNSYFNMILHKQFEIDKAEMQAIFSDKIDYLCKSIEAYLYCLEFGGKSMNHQNICIFRLVSLWTQNCQNNELNEIVKDHIFKIGTHRFHTLLHQLAARMSLKNSASNSDDPEADNETFFQKILIELIVKIAHDHPYHMLPIILQFANSHKDETILDSTKKVTTEKSRRKTVIKDSDDESEDDNKFLLAEDRVKTANYVIELLMAKDKKILSIITSMQTVCDAYIELANTVVPKQKNQGQAIIFPKHLLINKVKNFNQVNIFTHDMSIRSSCDYDKYLVHIVRIENTFKLANGVNLPKIIMCWGSDGISRKQLVKGRDDLRQDTVMQQFFLTVNDLIKSSNVRTNKLSEIRTYKIVPLSQKSGVLEWCTNTMTIGDWLTMGEKPGGAHKKYEPHDWTFDECRRRMHEVAQPQDPKKPVRKKTKHDVFLEICQNFKPVFRHFFMENFLDANSWFEKRLNYTRSVATSSIVGYIVGLGDRHVQNILVDLTNADVIHIDLGVAFEQGKILPIPELIPFRLTRDLIDGFGACGIEGIFKNCCESTLELLKSAQDQIITIFEVLLYDPLHNWCLSPKKAYMLQQVDAPVINSVSIADQSINSSYLPATNNTFNMDDQSGPSNKKKNKNKIAERILYRLKQKLTGYENGTQLSSKGHVNFLINQAVDTENLCRIYSGWQPYL